MEHVKKWFGKAFEKPIVRFLTIFLAAAAVLGLIVAAVKPYEEKEGDGRGSPNVILFADCDSVTGMQECKIGGARIGTVNHTYFTQGSGALGGDMAGASYVYSTNVFYLWYQADMAVDISNMTHFAFDIYVQDASQLNGNLYTVEIGSTEEYDTDEIQTTGMSFEGLKNGWNTIELELSAMGPSDDVSPDQAFDPTHTVRFRIYNGASGGTADGLLLFDNFRFLRK